MVLQVSVASAEHGIKAGNLHLAPFTFARLLIMTMATHFFQSPFAVDALFQSAQRFFYGLPLFKFNLCQSIFTSSPTPCGLREQLKCSTRLASGLSTVEDRRKMSIPLPISFCVLSVRCYVVDNQRIKSRSLCCFESGTLRDLVRGSPLGDLMIHRNFAR